MKHAVIFAFCVALAMGGSPAVAQMKAFSCPAGQPIQAKQAEAILAKVQEHYSGIASLSGAFRQESYVAALDEGEASSGEMLFSKPGRMRWTYTSPREQEVVIKGKELWFYQADKRQVLIDDVGNVLLSNLPVMFMMGLGNVSRDFQLNGACRGADGVVLNLVPNKAHGAGGESDALEGFQLLVDEGKGLPKGAKITSLGGNITAILFTNLRVGESAASDSRFVLDLPKGVDVMDRRVN